VRFQSHILVDFRHIASSEPKELSYDKCPRTNKSRQICTVNAAVSIAVIGESIIDIVETNGERKEHLGGSPANVVRGLARLGTNVLFLTHIGRDARANRFQVEWAHEGVRLLGGSSTAKRTPTAVARIAGDGSATYEFDIDWRLPTAVDLGRPALVHVGSIATFLEPGASRLLEIVASAKQSAIITYDPNIRPAVIGDPTAARRRFGAMVRLSDVVKLSSDDLEWLYPGVLPLDGLSLIMGLGARLVILTTGGEGSILLSSESIERVDARRVPVIDTIGAGDTYMSAVIDSLASMGMERLGSDELRSIGERATAASAFCVQHAGAEPPTREELDQITTATSLLMGNRK
jgi:fructokinase